MDLISRQAAIDALENIGSLDTDADREYARGIFNALPSVQPLIRTEMSSADDMISRQAAIDLFLAEGMITAAVYVERMPSAQPDIVACGDCIHWICHDRRCGYWNHGVKPLDWCCHAERRTNG